MHCNATETQARCVLFFERQNWWWQRSNQPTPTALAKGSSSFAGLFGAAVAPKNIVEVEAIRIEKTIEVNSYDNPVNL